MSVPQPRCASQLKQILDPCGEAQIALKTAVACFKTYPLLFDIASAKNLVSIVEEKQSFHDVKIKMDWTLGRS